jgi:hypothetical protein
MRGSEVRILSAAPVFANRRAVVPPLDQAAIFSLFNGGVARNAIAARFQALIAITTAVRSTSSFSEKWRRARLR